MRAILFSVLALSIVLAAELPLSYPHTRKTDQVDDYHGVKVADPYRWLEDDKSPETLAWVAEENKITFAYLNQIPYRAQLRERLRQLLNYARYSPPVRRGDQYFFTKNDGLQNQSVWYVQTGLDGAPELLLDPNKLSADGTTRLAAASISRDGKYLAYGVSSGGSDWLEAHVMEVSTRKVLPDQLKWLKVTGLAWAKDGFFYSRYPAPAAGHELYSKNEFHQVYFHHLGTAQSGDQLVYEDKAHPQRFNTVQTSEDERFAILDISDRRHGKKGNALFYRDLSEPESTFRPIVAEIGDDSYNFVENIGGLFLIETDHGAPNHRVMLFDPVKGSWKDVLPERAEPLQSASAAGGKLFALYSKDVATHAYVYSLDGKLENEIALPGLGVAGGFFGLHDDRQVFYSFTSLNYPPAIFRYDIATRKSAPFRVPEIPGFHPGNYESKEVFVTSKGKDEFPCFWSTRKD